MSGMPTRIIPVALFCAFATALPAALMPWEKAPNKCQILDNPAKPIYEIGVGYVPESLLQGAETNYNKAAFVELDADLEMAYFRDVLYGDIDARFVIRGVVLPGSRDELELPDQVAKLALDAGWTWRYDNGSALQVRTLPGIYSDIEEINGDVLYAPVSCSVIKAFDSQLSGIAGIEIRPHFERKYIPIIGVAWEINDQFRLDARLPESRFTWFLSQRWNSALGFEWQNTSYSLRDDREQITFEDFRLSWGVTRWLSDQLQFTSELGTVFDRSVEFKEAGGVTDKDLDIDKAFFVRFALAGPF